MSLLRDEGLRVVGQEAKACSSDGDLVAEGQAVQFVEANRNAVDPQVGQEETIEILASVVESPLAFPEV